MTDNEPKANSIYLFRCNDSGLYAFTADHTGQILPSHLYPRIRWRFERCVAIQPNQKPAKKEAVTATLDAIKKHGFYLTHAGPEFVGLADGSSGEVEQEDRR